MKSRLEQIVDLLNREVKAHQEIYKNICNNPATAEGTNRWWERRCAYDIKAKLEAINLSVYHILRNSETDTLESDMIKWIVQALPNVVGGNESFYTEALDLLIRGGYDIFNKPEHREILLKYLAKGFSQGG